MSEHEKQSADWSAATFEGNRLRQLREFQALSLREKIERIEEMAEVAAHFAARRATPRATDETRRESA